MQVVDNASLSVTTLPGIEHRTLASNGAGTAHLSIWKQTLAPGAATPVHFHDCEEAVLVESGAGEVRSAKGSVPFLAGQTLLIPVGEDHQIVNLGPGPMTVVGVFPASPVGTFAPDGEAMDLPWRS